MAFNYEFPYTDPNLYNDDWLLKRMKELLAQMADLEVWRQEYEDAYEAFKDMVEAIESGNFPQSIRDAFSKWMSENAITLVGELVKMVYFGITDTGHFVAYIPDGWEDIIFNTTGFDIAIAGEDFGHLTLSFDNGGN